MDVREQLAGVPGAATIAPIDRQLPVCRLTTRPTSTALGWPGGSKPEQPASVSKRSTWRC